MSQHHVEVPGEAYEFTIPSWLTHVILRFGAALCLTGEFTTVSNALDAPCSLTALMRCFKMLVVSPCQSLGEMQERAVWCFPLLRVAVSALQGRTS